MLRSLQARVTVLATVILIVVLGLASVLIVSLVGRQVSNELGEQNERTLTEIAALIEQGEDPSTIRLPLGSDGTEYLILDENGKTVQATIIFSGFTEVVSFDDLPEGFLPDGVVFDDTVFDDIVFDDLVFDGPAFDDPEFDDPDFDAVVATDAAATEGFIDPADYDESFIQASAPDGRRFEVIGLTPNRVVERSVDQVRSVLWLVIPLLAALFAGFIWLLTSRMLKPVAAMTARANTIRTETLHERLVEPGTGDEIDRLAITLNSMLDRLDAGARQQEQFVSDASHELKSPLTVMIGEAELAAASEDRDRLAEANALVVQQGRRLTALVDDLLALARSGEAALRRHEVDLDDVIRDQAAAQDHSIGTTEVQPARLTGDLEALSRLIRNLLENAVRHAEDVVQVSCTIEAGEILVNVDDDGPGIPNEHRDRVFERFARVDQSRTRTTGGTGLGLAISLAIAEAHGGTLTVNDSPLGGARLSLSLPVGADS